MQTAEGKLYLYVAIDRTSKFAFVQLVKKTGSTSAFLVALIAAVPYTIHTVLTEFEGSEIDPVDQFPRERHPVHLPAALHRWPHGQVHDPHVRHALPREWHRAQVHQGQASVDH